MTSNVEQKTLRRYVGTGQSTGRIISIDNKVRPVELLQASCRPQSSLHISSLPMWHLSLTGPAPITSVSTS